MTDSARKTAALLALIVSVAGIWWTAARHECNISEKALRVLTQRIVPLPKNPRALVARENVKKASDCIRIRCGDVRLHSIMAANQRLIGDEGGAVATYERALQQELRPELLYNLGLTHIDAGEYDRGLEIIARACELNPTLLFYLRTEHSGLVDEVRVRIKKRADSKGRSG